jgi:hypothetical protein
LCGSLRLFSVRYRTKPQNRARAGLGACVRQRTELPRACAYAHQAPGGVRTRLANPLTHDTEEKPVTLGTILLIILVLMLIGAIPRWSHSRNWGYGPSGGLGLVLVVVVALLLMGRL